MITVVQVIVWPAFIVYHSKVTLHFEDHHDNTVLYVQKTCLYHDTMSTKHGTSSTLLMKTEVNACLRSADTHLSELHTYKSLNLSHITVE